MTQGMASLAYRLPIVNTLRNELKAPSEDIPDTLAAMQDTVSRKSGACG